MSMELFTWNSAIVSSGGRGIGNGRGRPVAELNSLLYYNGVKEFHTIFSIRKISRDNKKKECVRRRRIVVGSGGEVGCKQQKREDKN